MGLDPVHILEGFTAHLLGGIIGGLTGWFLHTLYGRFQRKRQHAQFDREIEDFVTRLKSLISREEMPLVMERVVPLTSRATFGTEVPPLKEKFSLPTGVKLHCTMCERSINATFEGRCPSCKLGLGSYHEPQ
jgi:hypothetical protein